MAQSAEDVLPVPSQTTSAGSAASWVTGPMTAVRASTVAAEMTVDAATLATDAAAHPLATTAIAAVDLDPERAALASSAKAGASSASRRATLSVTAPRTEAVAAR